MVIGLCTWRLFQNDGEVRPNPGWPTMTGTSSGTTRRDATANMLLGLPCSAYMLPGLPGGAKMLLGLPCGEEILPSSSR